MYVGFIVHTPCEHGLERIQWFWYFMVMKNRIQKLLAAGILLLSVSLLEASPLRSISDIFPGLDLNQRGDALSAGGLRNTFFRHEAPLLVPAPDSGIDILSTVMNKNPVQLVEALFVVPYSSRILNKLDAYNAIGRIENIRNHLIFSRSRDMYMYLFEESTRLYNGRRNRPIPDPPPSTVLPASETVYIRLRDAFFGTTYLRGNLTTGRHGITYSLTNNAAIWFLMFPVMRAERFAAIFYVEPVAEGMLVYSVAGMAIPEFIANRMNLAASIDMRVTVFFNWLSAGFGAVR